MPKKAPKSKTQMIKDQKAEILSLEERLLAANDQIESLQRHPPVLATDRDEQGNVLAPEKPAAPSESPAQQAKPDKPNRFKLPDGRPFRVIRSGEAVFLTAKAMGVGKVTMQFPTNLALRVGRVMCKAALQQPEEATVSEEPAQA